MNCAKKGWVCRTNPCESGYVVALFQETLHYLQALWCASMFTCSRENMFILRILQFGRFIRTITGVSTNVEDKLPQSILLEVSFWHLKQRLLS